MFPAEQFAQFSLADEFFLQQRGEEALAEKFGQGLDGFDREEMETVLGIEEAGGGEDMEVRVEAEPATIP